MVHSKSTQLNIKTNFFLVVWEILNTAIAVAFSMLIFDKSRLKGTPWLLKEEICSRRTANNVQALMSSDQQQCNREGSFACAAHRITSTYLH